MVIKARDKCQERHLDPSVYEKLNKTRDLIGKGVDPGEFTNQGGLDLETYEALQLRWNNQEQAMQERKQEVIEEYGSLKAAPLSVGPCRKIEPVIGAKNALVLLTEFKDKKHAHSPDEFETLLFAKGSGHSMRDYYLEASWNQLDISGKVNDKWYSASSDRLDYVDKVPVNGHYPHAQKLITETVMQAKKSGKINFAPFSKDGKIDILIVVFAGEGLDTKLNIKYIRPHKDSLSEPIEVQEGIWVEKYALIPELPFDLLGCFCHEMGHFLGLPDLYKEGYSPIVGSWCLMAAGDHINDGKTPAHPSAWCKIHLGWTKPQLLKGPPQEWEIPAIIDQKGVIYKVDVADSNGEEYFLLENRQQKGFDSYLPGSGLLIWHVDQSRCVHLAPNSDPKHFFLTLAQSDGKNELQKDKNVLIKEEGEEEARKDGTGDEGDAYPGITVHRDFDGQSNPNSNSYDGAKSMVSVKSISDSKDVMQAKIGVQQQSVPPTQPTQPAASNHDQLMLQNFIALMASQKDETPYDEGYEDGKQDIIEKLKEELGLNSYQNGYQEGYRHGHHKVKKKLKK